MFVWQTLYRVMFLLVAMATISFAAVHAQDFDAVERHLGEAVAQGILTLEQADTMMEALREEADDQEDEDAIEEWFEGIGRVGERLKAAVKAGKLTEEQAWEKWRFIKEEEIAPKLKAAVKEGDLTEKQGWTIWKGIEKAEAAERAKAVAAKCEKPEKPTCEKDADKCDNKTPDREADGAQAAARARKVLTGVRKNLGKLVEEGKITPEAARKRMQGVETLIRERMANARKTQQEGTTVDRPNWENIKKRIESAVDRGDMTRDEANAKYREIRRKMAGQD